MGFYILASLILKESGVCLGGRASQALQSTIVYGRRPIDSVVYLSSPLPPQIRSITFLF